MQLAKGILCIALHSLFWSALSWRLWHRNCSMTENNELAWPGMTDLIGCRLT